MDVIPGQLDVGVAVPLERELVSKILSVDPRISVGYEPDLLPLTRYRGDHRGRDGFTRTGEGQARWQAMLARSEVLFGIPGDSPDGLATAVHTNPGLRWVQATAAGAGEQVRAAKLTEEELARVTITSSSGVHALPLAEFCLLGLLAFVKDLPRLVADQRTHRWHHHPVPELRGRTLLVVGLGKIGREVARLAQSFGMHVVGINRSGESNSCDVEETHDVSALFRLVAAADALVISLPLTDETRGLIDTHTIAAMKPSAIVVNVGRGGVIDEDALVRALREGRLAGAALDVYATEPLAAQSELWDLPNVLLSPHTAGLSVHENERIVTLSPRTCVGICEVRSYSIASPPNASTNAPCPPDDRVHGQTARAGAQTLSGAKASLTG